MKLIYEPKGLALEYGALAANLYKWCPHGCTYCYAAIMAAKHGEISRPAEFHRQAEPRAAVRLLLGQLEAEARKLWLQQTGPVFFSFSCDPYNPSERVHRLTRRALDILAGNNKQACVLTKAPSRAMDDLKHIAFQGHILGTSLTTLDMGRAQKIEPNADPPSARLAALEEAKAQGVPVWASLEPVLWPRDTLDVARSLAGIGAHLAIGPLNHRPYRNPPDWGGFLDDLRGALERAGYRQVDMEEAWNKPRKTYYLKKDLAKHALNHTGD